MSESDRYLMWRGVVVVVFGLLLSGVGSAQQAPLENQSEATAPLDRMMTTFLTEHRVPGASLVVTRNGKLVYARGFGYADREQRTPATPTSLFRIASISKPITAATILKLVEQEKFRLDQSVWEYLNLAEPKDPRWKQVTIEHLLRHTGGWDRGVSFDPMFRSVAFAQEQNRPAPATCDDIIACMLTRDLDADPGSRYAYSNFGYCLLGRVIEKATDQPYEQAVNKLILRPLGIRQTRLGRTPIESRVANEVTYYAHNSKNGRAVFPPLNRELSRPYGAWCLEAMDAHGGWISSTVDLVRFACAFDDPERSLILKSTSIAAIFARPDQQKDAVYYGYGWQVRDLGKGRINTWHNGLLDGTSSILVRRHDGLNWAVLFNTDRNPDGKVLAGLIDPLVHEAVNSVKDWPSEDLFEKNR